jgi:hypothetical protein
VTKDHKLVLPQHPSRFGQRPIPTALHAAGVIERGTTSDTTSRSRTRSNHDSIFADSQSTPLQERGAFDDLTLDMAGLHRAFGDSECASPGLP